MFLNDEKDINFGLSVLTVSNTVQYIQRMLKQHFLKFTLHMLLYCFEVLYSEKTILVF
jgi:hypothetical protein